MFSVSGVSAAEPAYAIIERGEDYAVYEGTVTEDTVDGAAAARTSRFTLIENGLHYLDNGKWLPSQDLVEPSAEGAIARYGPHPALFYSDLGTGLTFDLEIATGQHLRGGVRTIQLTDPASGVSQVIGKVRPSVSGTLVPPNRVVYQDAFEGLSADVIYEWRHDVFDQTVVLREQPELPAVMKAESTRIEVVTELETDVEAALTERTVAVSGGAALADHPVIQFGRLAMVVGQAYATDGGGVWGTGPWDPSREGQPVLKQYHKSDDGRSFLVESVGWSQAAAQLQALPLAQNPLPRGSPALDAQGQRIRPAPVARTVAREPMRLAQAAAESRGYAIDFVILPDNWTTTFLAGQTYYLKSHYYTGNGVSFQQNCTLKFKNNVYMLLLGTILFPNTSDPTVTFTSRDDNAYGQPIYGVPGEANSDGIPTDHRANVALWVYYPDTPRSINNARFRWASTCVRTDGSTWGTHTLQNCVLQNSGVGINAANGSQVTLTNVKRCEIFTPSSGNVYGSMVEDCGVVSVARVNDPAQDNASGDPNKNSQTECSFVLGSNSRVIAAFFDTHLSAYALGQQYFPGIVSPRSTGWARSTDGGVSFTDQGPLAPYPAANTWYGDAGDPIMARDNATGHIYLVVNPSREEWAGTWKGFRVWRSTDNGQSFSPLSFDVFNGVVSWTDKEMIAVNNFTGLSNSGYVYVAGARQGYPPQLYVTWSTNGGQTWKTNPDLLGTGWSPDFAIRPNGTVYVFYLVSTLVGSSYQNSIQYRYLRAGWTTWEGPETVPAHPDSDFLYATAHDGSGNLLRSNTAAPEDYFISNGFPRTAVNPVNGRVYVVYADLPSPGSTTDRGDIFIQDAWPHGDGSLDGHWSGARRVNNDATATDQWNPSIAVNPSGTKLFIGYYSRHNRPAQNDLIRAYGSRATITTGVTGVTFDLFPISPSASAPLFPGTTTSTPSQSWWLYDAVWAQDGVCLSTSAEVLVPCPEDPYHVTAPVYQHFMADDYTWAAADGAYFFYAYCDRSLTHGAGAESRPDVNIQFAKIQP